MTLRCPHCTAHRVDATSSGLGTNKETHHGRPTPIGGTTAGGPPQRRTTRRATGGLCAALCLALVALPTGPAAAEVTDPDPSFEVSDGDLRFILKQIKISEAHPYDGDLLCESPTDTTGTCVPDPKLPWGLRTVSGIYNNLNPARADYGAADRPFPA